MNKYLAATVLCCFTTPSFGNRPAICNSPDFVCVEGGPNYVVVYPVGNRRGGGHEGYYHDPYYGDEENFNPRRGENGSIEVDLGSLTWTAFDDGGEMVRSGRVSGGKDYCPDIGRGCRTVTGTYTIYSKGGEDCKSTRFPVGKGGAPMPYCMFFHGGYALHGSNAVPDYNASHGCVRMDPDDAQWLNESFVETGRTRVKIHY